MSDYEVNFELVMPGMSKSSHFVIRISGSASQVEAMSMAIEEWKRITEPRDVRVRELPNVVN
jgi:hypothetical protein